MSTMVPKDQSCRGAISRSRTRVHTVQSSAPLALRAILAQLSSWVFPVGFSDPCANPTRSNESTVQKDSNRSFDRFHLNLTRWDPGTSHRSECNNKRKFQILIGMQSQLTIDNVSCNESSF